MRRTAWVALLGLLACDGDVGGGPGMPDAGVDAAGGGLDAGADATAADAAADAACQMIRVAAPVLADTILGAQTPELNFGNGPVMNVGTGIDSIGILRFDVSALPANAEARAARVVLSAALSSIACGSEESCVPCGHIEADGNLSLLYLRSDWVEAQASWNSRMEDQPWSTPGAGGAGVDRSEDAVALVRHEASAGETFELDSDRLGDLRLWRVGNEVSFVLVPSMGGVFVLASRESAAEDCVDGGYPVPRLEVDFCQ